MIRRGKGGAAVIGPGVLKFAKWVVASREDTNLTYDLTDRSITYLAHTIAAVTRTPFSQVIEFINEARYSHELREYVISKTLSGPDRERSDEKCQFGRRLGGTRLRESSSHRSLWKQELTKAGFSFALLWFSVIGRKGLRKIRRRGYQSIRWMVAGPTIHSCGDCSFWGCHRELESLFAANRSFH